MIVFRNDKLIILDHGKFLKQPPIPGLFHQPKPHFKLKNSCCRHVVSEVFQSISYPSDPWFFKGDVPSHKNCQLSRGCIDPGAAVPYPSQLEKLGKDVITLKETGIYNRFTSNNSGKTLKLKAGDATYIIPPYSSFLLSDIYHFDMIPKLCSRFPRIVLDPPWLNKSVKRGARYQMLSTQMRNNREGYHDRRYEKVGYMFDKLPIPSLLSPGGVVAVWVTNKPSYIEHVLNSLFPRWGLELVRVCFWLKVTTSGEPIVPFHSPHKKPYEMLFFGQQTLDETKEGTFDEKQLNHLVSFPLYLLKQATESLVSSPSQENEQCNTISPNTQEVLCTTTVSPDTHASDGNTISPDTPTFTTESSSRKCPATDETVCHTPHSDPYTDLKRVIVSVPCVQHSRKPPLTNVFNELFPVRSGENGAGQGGIAGTEGLEVFARNLTPGWTSWGNEVLQFQDVRYFTAGEGGEDSRVDAC
eukprot:sb/3464405/